MRHPCLLTLLPAAALLSGCVAAAIPLVAGGAVARSGMQDRAKRQRQAPPVRTEATVVPASAPLPAPLPRNAADVRPGQLYAGTLPPPDGQAAKDAAVPAAATWSDVGHYVAANLSPERSLLLQRGSSVAEPRWVACAGKPLALLAPASVFLAAGGGARPLDPDAKSWADALRIFGVRTVLVAADPAEAAAVKAAFAKAGLPALVDGDTSVVAEEAAHLPAVRADVGARYCVVAVVGRAAADFPNALTPATTPPALGAVWGKGWFLLAGG